MTTYRQRLVWLVDGEYTTRNRGKSQSVNRTLDRRIKRRQHRIITAEAVDSWYADGADTLYEYLNMFDEFEAQENAFWEPEYDEREDYYEEPEYPYDPYEDYIDDGWASYHYADDRISEFWGDTIVHPEDKRFIEREDVGKSLGEILEEIQQKQRR